MTDCKQKSSLTSNNHIDRSTEGVIKSWFDYNENTNKVVWKKWVSPDWYTLKKYHKRFLEERAGKNVSFYTRKDGYLAVRVAHIPNLMAHHIVWVLVHGSMPEDCIDHIDGDPKNNHPDNLRCVTRAMNNRNAKLRKDNKSGISGVYWNEQTGKWRVQIRIGGDFKHIGLYEDFKEAVEARDNIFFKNKHMGYTKRHGKARGD